MMKTLLISATLFLTLAIATSAIACDYPARAKIVSGATATKDEMIASQKSVKTFMAEMEDYLACLEKEENDAKAELVEPDAEAIQKLEEMITKKHDAAVEEMNIIANRFNEEVRAYKAKAD